MNTPLITSDPEILGGTPVFAGTRDPGAVLFENLVDGLGLDEILDSYPKIKREQAIGLMPTHGSPCGYVPLRPNSITRRISSESDPTPS